VQADDRVPAIVRTSQHLAELDLGHALRSFAQLGGRFAQRVFAFLLLRDVKKEAGFFQVVLVFFPAFADAFEGGLLSEDGLGFFAVVPEVGSGSGLVQRLDSVLLGLEVKDASVEAATGLPTVSIALWFLQTWLPRVRFLGVGYFTTSPSTLPL
jgi:hypothetical protein